MPIPLVKIDPCAPFADRFEDGEIHYGICFRLPPDLAPEAARKCTRFDTHSRHGTVDQWSLCRPSANMTATHYALLIPRSWLIVHGFLPLSALFRRRDRMQLRCIDRLYAGFWLEWDAPDRQSDRIAA